MRRSSSRWWTVRVFKSQVPVFPAVCVGCGEPPTTHYKITQDAIGWWSVARLGWSNSLPTGRTVDVPACEACATKLRKQRRWRAGDRDGAHLRDGRRRESSTCSAGRCLKAGASAWPSSDWPSCRVAVPRAGRRSTRCRFKTTVTDNSVNLLLAQGDRLVEWSGLGPGARVLDVAAGTGAASLPAQRPARG